MLLPISKSLPIAVLVSVVCAAAQQAPPTLKQRPADTPPGTAVIHTGVQLVVVDAVVRDKSGNVVHGLTKDDFVVKEANAPQTVRHFEEFTSDVAKPMTVPKMPALPAGEFTNYTPVPAGGPLVVLLVDSLNTPISDQDYLRKQLVSYVQHAPPGARIAVFGLGTKLYMLQGFTTDPHILQAAVANVKAAKSSPLLGEGGGSQTALTDAVSNPFDGAPTTDSQSALTDANLIDFMAQTGIVAQALRIQYTIEGFTVLAHWLENFPGRKNVLWFSGAFPLGVVPNASLTNNTDIPGEDSIQFQSMVNLMTQARIAVYPIDARGLQSPAAFQASNAPVGGMSGLSLSQASSAEFAQNSAEHATMQALASDTGGKALYNRNDLVKATTDAINDGANFYTIAYTPSEHKEGGEWRSIKVELTPADKFKGYTLDYRRGYYAENLKVPARKTGEATVSAADYTPAANARTYARLALAHGGPALTDILFTARITPHNTADEDTVATGNVLNPKSPIPPPFRRMDVDVLAPPRYFTLTKDDKGTYKGALEVAIKEYSVDGALLNIATKTLVLSLTAEAYENFKKNNVGVHLEMSVPAKKDAFLRIAFADLTSEKIGTMEVETAPLLKLPPVN